MRIPKGTYDDETLAPAWLPIQDSAGKLARPIIRCRCRRLMGIRLHHVHADGRVTESFYHLHPTAEEEPRPEWRGCGFHEYLELDGYDGPEFPPGG